MFQICGLREIPKFSHMIKISLKVIDFHEQKEVNGVRFWPYVAGHVLGACMFMIEIAGVKILYTGQSNTFDILCYVSEWLLCFEIHWNGSDIAGDFSCLEDRHLCAAELPTMRPDVLISVCFCSHFAFVY